MYTVRSHSELRQHKAAKYTQQKATKLRIKDEIKFLYKKKQNLNNQIYSLHLHLANNWGSLWSHTRNSIDQELEKFSTHYYTKLESTLRTLQTKQQKLPDSKETFAPRIVNNTDIQFSDDEVTLLNKGLKYNLSYKNKNWIKNLAL